MGNYRIPIRLYKRHDLDLIYLHLHPEFSLPRAMKVALMGFVNHENFLINVPKPSPDNELDFRKFPKKPILFFIYLKEDEDSELIDFIKKMPDGYRNSLVKNVFRNYLSSANLYGYYTSTESAIKAHSQSKPSNIDYENLFVSEYCNYFNNKSEYNIINIIKSKKKIKKKKKHNTSNIPIEQLPEAILTDKIYDDKYLAQFERNADIEQKSLEKQTTKQKLPQKPSQLSSDSVNQELVTEDINQKETEQSEDFDFFGDMEALINSL